MLYRRHPLRPWGAPTGNHPITPPAPASAPRTPPPRAPTPPPRPPPYSPPPPPPSPTTPPAHPAPPPTSGPPGPTLPTSRPAPHPLPRSSQSPPPLSPSCACTTSRLPLDRSGWLGPISHILPRRLRLAHFGHHCVPLYVPGDIEPAPPRRPLVLVPHRVLHQCLHRRRRHPLLRHLP